MKTPVRLSLLLSAALVATSSLLADSFTPGNYTYTVTTSGVYQITVAGAAGGNSSPASGGKGAVLTANFSLSSGDILSIGVGAQGCSTHYSGCGGGGSLVQIQGGTLLLDAGAGGGAGYYSQSNGGDALLTPDGESSQGGSGGTGGADGGPVISPRVAAASMVAEVRREEKVTSLRVPAVEEADTAGEPGRISVTAAAAAAPITTRPLWGWKQPFAVPATATQASLCSRRNPPPSPRSRRLSCSSAPARLAWPVPFAVVTA